MRPVMIKWMLFSLKQLRDAMVMRWSPWFWFTHPSEEVWRSIFFIWCVVMADAEADYYLAVRG